MKALKKVIIIVLTAVMLVSVLAVPAAACVPAGKNTAALTVSVYDIKLMIAESIAANANAMIEKLVADAQAQENPDIAALIAQTNAISALAVSIINALGFDAVCEYVEYEIAGQIVEIDPIIVIPLTD